MQTQVIQPEIGVIGGTGPYAGLDLVKKIFDQTLARTDQEHLLVALLSLPSAIPDRTAYLLGRHENNPGEAIAQIALQLARMGTRVAAIACNTAHADVIFQPVLKTLREARSELKMLHMIGETIRFLREELPECRRVGVLSTTGSYQMRLYAQPLEEAGYCVITPTPKLQEEMVHPAIYQRVVGIKTQSNPVHPQARHWLEVAVRALKEDGAEVVILGCTELPLALTEAVLYGLLMIDPTTILARALIREIAPGKVKPLSIPYLRSVI